MKWFVLGKVFLVSGTQFVAAREVRHPEYVYEGRVDSFGYLDRSISVPSGIYQGADCRIRLIDTDRQLTDILSVETPRRRFIELRMVPEGESEAAREPFGTLEIYSAEFMPGIVELVGRDPTFGWRDKRIPGHINRTNFPELMDGIEEGFIPIWFGINESEPTGSPPVPQGVVQLPRMTLSRWGFAQNPYPAGSEVIYRLNPGDSLYAVVDPSEYTITQEDHTFNGITYSLQFLDFNSDQDAAALIRADAHGINFRGDFGSMPFVSTPTEALRNPIDSFINMLYSILANEVKFPRFNIDSFASVRERMAIALGGSPAEGYKCDGVIAESYTAGEFLARFLPSFELDFYANKYGELEVNFTDESDPGRPLFSQGPIFDPSSDRSLILKDTVRQRIADPTVNRLRYNFAHNYALQQWARKEVFDNEDDQLALAGDASPLVPAIEEGQLDQWFVRDVFTADDVARRRMNFLALGSYRIEFQCPLPEVFEDLELAKLIGVSSVWGLAVGGYLNAEFKTTGLTYGLDQKLCTIRGVLRVPANVGTPLICPLNKASTCEEYEYSLRAPQMGPGTWAIVGGALPEGLTLNASTGEISGTPQNSGTYNYTAQFTDNSDPAVIKTVACQIDVWTCIHEEAQHPVIETLNSSSVITSPGWTPIRYNTDLEFDGGNINNTHPQISTLVTGDGALQSQRFDPGLSSNPAESVGFFNTSAGAWADWEVHALWDGDSVRTGVIPGEKRESPAMCVVGPVTINPARLIEDPSIIENPKHEDLRYYAFVCRRAEAPNAASSELGEKWYQFNLARVEDGAVTIIGQASPAFREVPSGPETAWYQSDDFAGHEISIRCLCLDHGDGECGMVLGLIDGEIAVAAAGLLAPADDPRGWPGYGNMFNQLDEIQTTIEESVYARLSGEFWAERLGFTNTFSLRIVEGLRYGGQVKVQPCPLSEGTRSLPYTNSLGGSSVVRLSAFGGTPPYTWALTGGSLPAGLTFSNSRITGTPTESGTFSFTVRVRDRRGAIATKSCSLTIGTVDPVQITTTCPLPDANRGLAYEEQLEAEDGLEPYTWDLASGSLPDGLSLSSSGLISGTPTEEGIFTFTIRVTDSDVGQTDTLSCQLTVDPPLPLEITTVCPLSSGAVDTPYSGGFAATGGVPPYTWTMLSGDLPDGLTFNSDGTITGTPTETGDFTIEAEVTDSQSPADSDVLECDLEIAGAGGTLKALLAYQLLGPAVFDDGFDTTYSGSGIVLSADDISGATNGYLLIVARNSNGGGGADKFVDIVNGGGTVKATCTIPGNSAQQLVIATLSDLEATTYSVKVRAGNIGEEFNLEIREAYLLLEVDDAPKAKSSFTLLQGQDSTGGDGSGDQQLNNNSAFVRQISASTSYAYSGAGGTNEDGHRIFRKDEGNFATIDHWELEIFARNSAATGTFFGALFNKTTDTMVAGSEITFSNTDVNMGRKVVSFSNAATNFTNGEDFEVRFKTASSGIGQVAKVNLNVYLNPATETESHLPVINTSGSNSSSAAARGEHRYKHQPTLFETGTTFAFEMTAKEVGGSSSAFLFDASTSDTSVTGSDVGSSQLDFSTTNRERQRTGALTLTDGNRYLFRPASSGGQTIRQAGGWIIAVVPEP